MAYEVQTPVFEGPFDFLSWLSMRELVEPNCAVIILHSVSLKRRALAAITELAPDLMLLDIQMPGMSGLDMLAQVPRESMPMVLNTSRIADDSPRKSEPPP